MASQDIDEKFLVWDDKKDVLPESCAPTPAGSEKNFDTHSNRPVYNWKNITQEFFSSSEELQLGELLLDGHFGLFDAMSAIEIMDSKMDAGMLCNQAKRQVFSLKEGIAEGVIKVEDVTHSELIGIMDDSLAAIVTWLEGHSLAQTVFINLYLHNPELIFDPILKAFAYIALKLADRIRDQINRASVFEEEDFQCMTYGFKMGGLLSDHKVTAMVKDCEEELSRNMKLIKKSDPDSQELELAAAVHARLRFCRLLFVVLHQFERGGKEAFEEGAKMLTQMTELLSIMRETVELGIKPESHDCSPNDYPCIMGFDPLINQRLLPPTFPRYTRLKGREESFTYLLTLTENLQKITDIKDTFNLHNGLRFFFEFNWRIPCLLSRSVLKLAYLPSNGQQVLGQMPMTEAIRETVRSFILPPALIQRGPLSSNQQAKDCVDAFLHRCVMPINLLFQATCHNRARQRDKWGRMLEEFNTLQEEADRVDAYLHQLLAKVDPTKEHLANFGTWVLYHTLGIMSHYLLCGFELELYAPHEYHYIYWYLYECILNWHLSTVTRCENYLKMHRDYQQEYERVGKSNKKKGRRKGRADQAPAVHLYDVVIIQGYQQTCAALYHASVGLTISGKVRCPGVEFDSEEVRYNHRFGPFGPLLTPPVVDYDKFRHLVPFKPHIPQMQQRAEDFYAISHKHFQQAKSYFEMISSVNPDPDVAKMLKMIKTDMVVIKLLSSGHKKDDDSLAKFDFGVHPLFPVVKI